jgi:proteasome-associated ATPase
MSTAAPKKPDSIELVLLNNDISWEDRRNLLQNLIIDENPKSAKVLQNVLDKARSGNAESLYKKMLEEITALKQDMEDGPLRRGTFIRMLSNGRKTPLESNGNGQPIFTPRAYVRLEDGGSAYTVAPDAKLAKQLQTGDTVLLEPQCKALLFIDTVGIETGEEARLERRIDDCRVEISLRDHERHIYLAAFALQKKLDAEEVAPGDKLLVCSRREMAFDAIPNEDKLSHYHFLVKEPLPDVRVGRDIGAPPPFIGELVDHVSMEMVYPELARKYGVMPSKFTLLSGVSGAGKTLCIQGLWREVYEQVGETIGVPVEDLPCRVLRLRSSAVLSKWYGDSEKLIDNFFDEVETIAEQPFVAPDGKEHRLPTIVICEEADALGRARGGDAVHDRVENTILERLDVTRQKLRDQMILFLFSTNFPELVDPAFMRRAGGTTVKFTRLSRAGCSDVLAKLLRKLPLHAEGAGDLRSAVMSEVIPWLFSPNGADQGQVEMTYVGAATPELKHRRDFLTGAVLARAVQEAASAACQAERRGETPAGITARMLMAAIDRQVRSIVDQLHPANVTHYITLPDGARVANIRRLSQPAVSPIELTNGR